MTQPLKSHGITSAVTLLGEALPGPFRLKQWTQRPRLWRRAGSANFGCFKTTTASVRTRPRSIESQFRFIVTRLVGAVGGMPEDLVNWVEFTSASGSFTY